MSVDSKSNEQLSAFMDGGPVAGADRLAGRIARDEDLSGRWRRYHLIGDCLRREGALVTDRFTATLLSRIAEEPTVIAPPIRREQGHRDERWTRWAAGTAIAAGVAAVVVVGVVQLDSGPHSIVQEPVSAPASEQATVADVAGESGTRWDVEQPEIASKLDRYLANHSDFASRGSLNGMTPLATFVSYDE